jgi:hypothetical protein
MTNASPRLLEALITEAYPTSAAVGCADNTDADDLSVAGTLGAQLTISAEAALMAIKPTGLRAGECIKIYLYASPEDRGLDSEA